MSLVITYEPRFVNAKECAHILGFTKYTVYNLIKSGNIPAVKIGKEYRIPVKWLEEQEGVENVVKHTLEGSLNPTTTRTYQIQGMVE